MHETDLNEDWCVCVCVHSPPFSFLYSSPQQDMDHVASLVSWMTGYILALLWDHILHTKT